MSGSSGLLKVQVQSDSSVLGFNRLFIWILTQNLALLSRFLRIKLLFLVSRDCEEKEADSSHEPCILLKSRDVNYFLWKPLRRTRGPQEEI